MRYLKNEFKKSEHNNFFLKEMYRDMGMNFIGAYLYKNYSMIITEDSKELLKCISIKSIKQYNNHSLSQEDVIRIVKKFEISEYEVSGIPNIQNNEQGTIHNSLYIFEKPRLA